MTVIGATDYRVCLKTEYGRRSLRNPRYSLRAFARDIELSPARLSEVMNGAEPLSAGTAVRIARAMGFSDDETEYFQNLVEAEHVRDDSRRRQARLTLERLVRDHEFKAISDDQFRAIADWYHHALLELTTLSEFHSDPIWIAERLAIDVATVVDAVDRLVRLGLIDTSGTPWRATAVNTTVPGGPPSDAVKKLHAQILHLAEDALFEQPVTARDFSSLMLAVPKDKIDEARAMLKAFRRDFNHAMGSASQKDSVYVLSTQFFRLAEV